MHSNSDKEYLAADIVDEEGVELLADGEAPEEQSLSKVEGVDVGKLINRTLWEDFIDAFHQAKYPLVIAIIIVLIVAYQVTIGQYRIGPASGDVPVKHTWDTLKFIRPVLSPRQQHIVNQNALFGETTLQLPNNDAISFKFDPSSDKYGSFQLPELFYQGVCFSIGLGNSHNVDYASTKQFSMGDLFRRLSSLSPRPMYISPRRTERTGRIPGVADPGLFEQGWVEEGFLVYYSYKQLDEEGLLSSHTPTQPWKRVSESLLEVAREFKQMYVTVYYANAFGPSDTNQILRLAERNRQRRLLAETNASAAARYAYELPLANDRDVEQSNVYYLARGYEGEFTHSVDRREVTLIDDEVQYYKRENPKGPRLAKQHPKPSRTYPRLHRHLIAEYEKEKDGGAIITGTTSTMGYIKHDYEENGRPLFPEERRRRAAEAQATTVDAPSMDALRDSNKHKYENIIQEVLPAYTGLDKIRSKATVWLSRINHVTPSEVILDTFETLSFDTERARRASLTPAEVLFEGAQEHRLLLRDAEEAVALPHGSKIAPPDGSETEVEYFDYLMTAKGYNHVLKMNAFNVIYSKAWQRKAYAQQQAASDDTSFGAQAKHWSEFVPYDVAVKYAQKYNIPENEIEKP